MQVSDDDVRKFKVQMGAIAKQIRENAADQFNITLRAFVNDLYTAFKKRRVAIDMFRNQMAVALSGQNQAILVVQFHECFAPHADLIVNRDVKLFDECKDWKMLATMELAETWPRVPMVLQKCIWRYLGDLWTLAETFMRPEITDDEARSLLVESTIQTARFVTENGRIPMDSNDLINLSKSVSDATLAKTQDEQK